jgi:hypothetical protein
MDSTGTSLATYTRLGNQVAQIKLPRTGYCQYCGIKEAHVELYRPEGVSLLRITIAFCARAYYVCGRDHFENAIREEARAEIAEQLNEAAELFLDPNAGTSEGLRARQEEDVLIARAVSPVEWTVKDRYCWRCGTHGAVFKSETRCSKCGELQRLYVPEAKRAGS